MAGVTKQKLFKAHFVTDQDEFLGSVDSVPMEHPDPKILILIRGDAWCNG